MHLQPPCLLPPLPPLPVQELLLDLNVCDRQMGIAHIKAERCPQMKPSECSIYVEVPTRLSTSSLSQRPRAMKQPHTSRIHKKPKKEPSLSRVKHGRFCCSRAQLRKGVHVASASQQAWASSLSSSIIATLEVVASKSFVALGAV